MLALPFPTSHCCFSSRRFFGQFKHCPSSICNNQTAPSSCTPESLFPSLLCKISRRPIFPVSTHSEDVVSDALELSEDGSPNLLRRPTSLPPSTEELITSQEEDAHEEETDVLAPFLKLFKARDSSDDEGEIEVPKKNEEPRKEPKGANVEYYEPKAGDLVVGVVVSGNANKIDVNIGADSLGTMLRKEVLPLYDEESPDLLCDLSKDAEEIMVPGKFGVIRDEDNVDDDGVPERSVVELGTVLFAEVLGRTLSGRPLLSTRRLTRKIAWHRVRQIKLFNEPIEVRIVEWNTGGLLSRIEGLRAFLPKAELVNRVNSLRDLKENVGRRLFVKISRVDEDKNDLIVSEREAWDMLHLREGTLLKGTVCKIFPYGAQIRIGESNRRICQNLDEHIQSFAKELILPSTSGLLHMTNITRGRISSVSDLFTVGERVKVLVVKSTIPDKISLSTAELESEPGLFLSNKEKVFAEAEDMSRRYRQRIPCISLSKSMDSVDERTLPFDDEGRLYANWGWFKFQEGTDL